MLRNTLLSVIAGLVLAGCPGPAPVDESGPDGDNRQISPDFAGRWTGTAVLTTGDTAYNAKAVTLDVTTSGPSLDIHVLDLCGPQLLSAEGHGRGTMWYGDLSCPTPLPGCETATVQYRSSIVKVLEDGRLYLLMHGTASGCGTAREATTEIRATK